MTGRVMRSLSLGAILSIAGCLFLGPLSEPARGAETAAGGSPSSSVAGEVPVPPVSKDERSAPISLTSDTLSYNPEEDSYEARGNVVLSQDGVQLQAQEVLWQALTQDADAQGDVRLDDAGTEITGERLQYNLATGQGQLHDGRVLIRQGNFHLAGDQIEKRGQAEYFAKKGSFTTCDGEIPDWKFSASEVDVTLGGYARARNVWFHVRDVPVFYSPYLMFPVKTDRESGLLAPSFGYSNNKGLMASLAWYQVIDRSMDATVYLDEYSDIGLGKGLEYRYALVNQNNGKALYYHVTGVKGTPNLYYLEWTHRGNLPAGWRMNADVEYADDQLFFDEFGKTAEEYNRDKTVSTLMLQRNWQKLNLVSYARYIKDLENDNDATLQRLPELGLGLARYRLGDTPLYLGLESYATRFTRDEGEDGERLYLKPSLAAVFTPGSWLELVPQVALHERLYNSDAEDNEQSVPELSLGLATRLIKDVDVDRWGIDRIQHSIEPQVTYTYVPDEYQDDQPLFDLYDRQLRQNDVTYAVINRLTARTTLADGSRAYREVFNLRLSQTYDIDEARNNRSGDNQPFSDVRAQLGVRPAANFSLDADARIPVYGAPRFNTLTVGSSVRDDVGNALRIDYSYIDQNFSSTATDYIDLKLETTVFRPLYANFQERYDFRESRELEKVVGLEYRSKCWSLLLTYRNRYRDDGTDDQEILFTFVLAGLGYAPSFGSGF
jgi:LPS-assembly protein